MTMKKKGDNIILMVRYTVDDTAGFEEAARDCCDDQFDIMDGETIAFESSEYGAFELHLIHLKEQEKDCLTDIDPKVIVGLFTDNRFHE